MGSMAALWLSAFLFFLGIIGFVAVSIASLVGEVEVKEHSILVLDLTGAINEREIDPSVSDILYNGYNAEAPTLNSMLESIRYAASDSNIDGIYINCTGSELGYASRRELIEALIEFKKSGKWIYAYGDQYTQGDYLVASIATRIFINPQGSVDLHGIASTTPFVKNALDKLGIEVQVFKVGEFKSAVEPFLLTEISESARLQSQVYIDSVWAEVTEIIAKNRKILSSQVDALADSMLVARKSQITVDAKLVDEICYRRIFENKLRALTKIEEDEDLRMVSPSQYLANNKIAVNLRSNDASHIAVLYALGDIVDNEGGGIIGAEMVPQIIKLANDENVKGLVLRVNSGGGSAFASEQIWEALEYFKKTKKPFYVSMGDYAASGGYYISCGADKIFADAETLTGSIGIFGMIPSVQKLLNNHLGVNLSTVSTNANASFPQITSPMTQLQFESMQRYVEDGYTLFTTRVAEGRGIAHSEILKIAEGRIWDGRSALRIGLIDQIGTLEAAILAILKETKLSRDNVIAYPEITRTPIEELLLSATNVQFGKLAPMPFNIEGMTPEEIRTYMSLLQRITKSSPIQARMEDITLK